MREVVCAGMVALGAAAMLAGVLVGSGAARADDRSSPAHPDKTLQQKLDLLDHGPDMPDAPLSNSDVDKGSFPHSWRVPGTNTSIRVYGSGTETLQYSR